MESWLVGAICKWEYAHRLPYIFSIGTQKPYFGSKGGPGFHLMSVCVVVWFVGERRTQSLLSKINPKVVAKYQKNKNVQK